MTSLTVADTINAISNDKSLALFNHIALEAGNSDNLKTRLGLTRKQYYSRMSDLINVGLVVRKNGKYFLTSFGKVVYEAQILIGKGIQNYWKLKAIDSIETSYVHTQLPIEEYNRFIDTLVDGNDIKDILLKNHNNKIAVTPNEIFYENQGLIHSTRDR